MAVAKVVLMNSRYIYRTTHSTALTPCCYARTEDSSQLLVTGLFAASPEDDQHY